MNESAIKKRKLNIPATASVWYMGTNIVTKGTVLLFTPIFTRILTPEQYGVYSLYVSWMGILTVIETLEISGVIMYRGLIRYKSEKDGYTASALTVQIGLTLIFTTVYILFRKRINVITSLSTPLSVLLLIQIFFNSAEGIYFSKERYSYGYKKVSLINIISGLLTPISALLIITITPYKSIGRIIASFAASAITAIPICILIMKKGKVKADLEKIKFILTHSFPMLPYYLSLSVIAQSDKIILAHMPFGASDIGKYSVAYSAGFMLSLFTAGASSALTPWVVRKLSVGMKESVKTVLEKSVKALSVLTLIFLCIIPEIFKSIAGTGYKDAVGAVYPLSISVILLFLIGIHSTALLHFERQGFITVSAVFTALFSVILNLILIRKFGYMGGAVSTLLSYTLLLSTEALILRKKANTALISISKGVINLLSLGFFAFILFLFKDVFLTRLLILLALIISLPYFIKDFRGIIKEN